MLHQAIPASGAPPVLIQKNITSYPLGKHLDILEDQDGTLTFEQVRAEPVAARFTTSHQENPNFGFTSSTYWVHFSLSGDRSGIDHWLLEIGYPLFDNINIYLPTADGTYLKKTVGDMRPFADREIKHRNLLFTIPASLPDNTPIYLRFETESTMNIIMTLWSGAAFVDKDHNDQFGLGLYHGFIIMMSLYSLLMWGTLRDKNYFYYLFFIVNFGLYQ
ncbi:MAG: hypothetical protein KAS94_08465, partial [Desulfobulbaceae bacterium]|nr:hypothetical protein [Desulfobulbaceae bacterium]